MISILFMTANPVNDCQLGLDVEFREISNQLQRAKKRANFKLRQYTAVRPQDISQALLDSNPQIIHFSGHGTVTGALCCENDAGEPLPIQPAALAELFAVFQKGLNCIILNACYSTAQADALVQHIPYVIGMSHEIEDSAAIAFSVGFYQALGAGRPIEDAYQLGCAQIRLRNISNHLLPCLLKRTSNAPASDLPAKSAPKYETKRSVQQYLKPFGEVDCESEVALLKENYSDYYFTETPFSKLTLNPEHYLIIGRRGTGKTALCEYFKFQDVIPNAIAIEVNEPAAFQYISGLINDLPLSRELVIPWLAKIWEVAIWSVIFRHLRSYDAPIEAACQTFNEAHKFLAGLTNTQKLIIIHPLTPQPGALTLTDLLSHPAFIEGKEAVFKLAYKRPLIVAFDTLENIDVDNFNMMLTVGSLLGCASTFNREYSAHGIHLKIFLMAEVFPCLKEEIILNPLKSIRDEVYMHWRPKNLMRLISWRFYKYLEANALLPTKDFAVDWKDHRSVLEKLWIPYFGDSLINGGGLLEKSFPYVLRHTQMRPRQLIVLCDRIARKAKEKGHFPKFLPTDLIEGIREGELDLADEVLNSYNTVYPKVGRILDALAGIPSIFEGKELDKRAPYTASEWPSGKYSPFDFRQLVSELGIVGRVRHIDEKSGIVDGDFEYFSKGRLGLLTADLCTIHPMFYKRLKINLNQKLKVYPFPDSPDFAEVFTEL